MSLMLERIQREERYGWILRWWRTVRLYAWGTMAAALIVLGVAANHTLDLHWQAQDAAITQQARR